MTCKAGSKIYWSVVVPKLCYGTEILELDRGCMEVMEKFHCSMAKHMQRLPKHASNSGSLMTIGWCNFKSHCNFLKLVFLWQLLTLPMSSVYKSVCIKRLCYMLYSGAVCKGPLNCIVKVCKEYGLFGILRMAIESGEYMRKHEWKLHVKDCINELDGKRLKTKCLMYNNLKLLDMRDSNMCVWWIHSSYSCKFTKQNEYIIRLLLNVSGYKQMICPCCELHTVNNISHVLFVCTSNNNNNNNMFKVQNPVLQIQFSGLIQISSFISEVIPEKECF